MITTFPFSSMPKLSSAKLIDVYADKGFMDKTEETDSQSTTFSTNARQLKERAADITLKSSEEEAIVPSSDSVSMCPLSIPTYCLPISHLMLLPFLHLMIH